MKLLNEYYDIIDAEILAEELEYLGIVTHISSKKSHSISSHITGAIKVGLWAVLEEQYEDAASYLKNPEHQITTGISAKKISKMKTKAKVSANEALNKFIAYTFIVFLLIAIAIYFIYINTA